ncbi:MAG: hypothetical protein ABFD52_00640 [Acidobacteriota bacterium]
MATLTYEITLVEGGNLPTSQEKANLKALFEKVVGQFNAIEGGADLRVTDVTETTEE